MNSHTNRIVHPPGWEHATLVRSPKNAADIRKATGASDSVKILLPTSRAWFDFAARPSQPVDDHVVIMRWHGARCAHCRLDSGVWAPDGHEPRDIDFGSCSGCHKIYGQPWHAISDDLLADVAMDSAGLSPSSFVGGMWGPPACLALRFAIAEMGYRNMLPEPDELRVAWDLAVSRGVVDGAAHDRMTMVEIWARCMPLLWGGYVRP